MTSRPAAPQLGRGLVVEGDPAGGIGGVARGGQRLKKVVETALAVDSRRFGRLQGGDVLEAVDAADEVAVVARLSTNAHSP
jgi:hypothetical protein